MAIRYIAFSGGVGGAKLALGLARALPPAELLIVGNTADDFEHLGLRICPDLDTLMYTLSGRANKALGWGIEGETWHCMDALSALGGADWFKLGDRDIATHLYRSDRLRNGATLGMVTDELMRAHGVTHRIVPMSDDPVATIVHTPDGALNFQDYFVRQRCAPRVTGFTFSGAEHAVMHEQLRAALLSPDLRGVIFCPSNPFVSIGPMLAIPGIRASIEALNVPIVAVSPIIGGVAIKGPAGKMMRELGMPLTQVAVAGQYRGLANAVVVDECDAAEAGPIRALGMDCLVTPTLMRDDADKLRLAQSILAYCRERRA